MQNIMSGKASDFSRAHRVPTSSTPLISRKDTIIIAMLVNIALLVVLFATASRRQESAKVEQAIQKQQIVVQSPVTVSDQAPTKASRKQAVDEIDEILARFANNTQVVKSEKAVATAPQTASQATTQPAEQEAEYYIVKSGDNPWTIARKFHIKFEDLLRLNNLDEAKAKNLKIGQKLRIR